MAEDTPTLASVMTRAEVQAEAVRRMQDIGQRLSALPQDNKKLLRLLEEVETCLLRVGQSLPEDMYNTLRATMVVLITNELLEHPYAEVKVVVASCLTEITRITAPEAPYDDDVMKSVFKRVVETFSELDNMNSPSFARRVSILDSVATVRCVVLMLDLDLDHLILDIFRHFLRTASLNHSEKVICHMETIMISVIQESDHVHAELASCLLQNLTKEAQETLPASFGLAERVLDLCRDKLKPVFLGLLKGIPVDQYSSVITLLLNGASDAVESNVDASGNNMCVVGDNMSDITDGSKSKCLKEAKETSLSKKNKMLEENMVGSRIKVWWPVDKMFYGGVVESFGASSKKHKVSYDDGDVEVLVLKKERWEFVAEEECSDRDVASDMPRGRRAKGSSQQRMGRRKTGRPHSGSDAKDPPKNQGHLKGSKNMKQAKLKEKGAKKDTQETPNAGSNLKMDVARPSQPIGKAKNGIVKASNKDGADSTDNSKSQMMRLT